MKSSRIALSALFIIALFTFPLASRERNAAEERKLVTHLQDVVKRIVEGADQKTPDPSIDIEAYLIDGMSFESLVDAARGRTEKCKLVEGSDSKVLFQSLSISDDRSAAFLVMKTHSAGSGDRFHSVVFFKGAQDDWKIKSWHISK